MVEEFARLDNEKMQQAQNAPNKIVYDCIDPSPYYENATEPYIDDKDIIEMQWEDPS